MARDRGGLSRKLAGSAGSSEALNGRDLCTKLPRRFSFTWSEANVALLLAEGLSYAEVAGRLGVSYHTVHTHVKAIHEKARVKSNGRLLALIRRMEHAGHSAAGVGTFPIPPAPSGDRIS